MEEKPTLPSSIKAAAGVFLLIGVGALVEIVIAATAGRVSPNVWVVGVPIGIGLLRLSRGWRTCALIFLWLTFFAILLVAGLLALAGPRDVLIYGHNVGRVSKEAAIGIVVGLFVLTFGLYRILTRPHVRKLFGLPSVTTAGQTNA